MEKKKSTILSLNFVYKLINRTVIWPLESFSVFSEE